MKFPSHLVSFSLSMGALLACLDGERLSVAPPPATSKSMLVFKECNRVIEARASSLDQSTLAWTEARCAEEAHLFAAYLPFELDHYGWTPGPVTFSPCEVGGAECCFQRKVSDVAFDALYRGVEGTVSEEILAWPELLASLNMRSQCACQEFGTFTQFELPSVDRSRLVRIDDTHLLLLVVAPEDEPGDRTSIHLIEPTDLLETGVDLVGTKIAGFRERGFGIDRDRRGRIVIGTSTNAVLLGDLEGGFFSSPRLPRKRNTRAARLRPDAEGDVEVAALSEPHPTEFYLLRNGQWTTFGDRSQITQTCRAGGAGNGQRPEIVWLGPDELLVMPHSLDAAPLRTTTTTTHPHGLWHKKGDTLRWVSGPGPGDDCLTSLAFVPGYGVVAGTQDGELFILEDDGWRRPELQLRGEPPQFHGDVFEISPIEGGFLFGGREGYLSYVKGDVLCANLKPSLVHLRSIVPFNGGYLISTDGRGLLGPAQLLRFEFAP